MRTFEDGAVTSRAGRLPAAGLVALGLGAILDLGGHGLGLEGLADAGHAVTFGGMAAVLLAVVLGRRSTTRRSESSRR
jgi:hypothetical protein